MRIFHRQKNKALHNRLTHPEIFLNTLPYYYWGRSLAWYDAWLGSKARTHVDRGSNPRGPIII